MNKAYVYRLPELVDTLRSSGPGKYVYRGQPKEWAGPLVPSLYRGLINANPFLDYSPEKRLRDIGNTFYLQKSLHSIRPQDLKEEWLLNLQKRMQRIQYYIGTYGYPLGQLLIQQFGYTSDGLDVTTDPIIAAFFAKFDFATRQYLNQAEELGVIYRWPVEISNVTLQELKIMDFFSCRSYLDGLEVFRLVADEEMSCWIPEIHIRILGHYIDEVSERHLRGEPYPLELLKLPGDSLSKGRIAVQHGGLLFPDMILCEHYLNDKFAPSKKCVIPGTSNAVEDLSTRPGVERFFFRHSQTDATIFDSKPSSFFPNRDQDPFHQLMLFTNAHPVGLPMVYIDSKHGHWCNLDDLPVYDPF